MVTATSTTDTYAAIATSQSKTDAATTQLFDNTEDFIKLLTVQLQNQDPTKPLETDQLTQQISSLSQVEQQININKNLQSLMGAYAQSQTNSAVSYIGKMVEIPGNQASLVGGQAVVVYNQDTESNDTKVTISNEKGDVVYTGSGTTLAGRNQLIWDGTTDAGEQAPDGTYTVSIKATALDGTTIKSTTSTAGLVTSLQTQDGATNLMLGDIAVPLDKVTSVRNMPVAVSQPIDTTDTTTDA